VDVNGARYILLLGRSDWSGCTEVSAQGSTFLSDAWATAAPPESPPSTPPSDFYWNPALHQLTLWPLLYAFPGNPSQSPVAPTDRRGSAADRFGNWYFIDPTRTKILVCNGGDQTIATFWPPDAPASVTRAGAFGPVAPPAVDEPWQLAGLAVTERNYLVVGSTQPAGLLIFDLYQGGEPRRLLWPEPVPFAPFDMAPRRGGGVWILDSVNKRYWSLDATFAVSGKEQETVTVTHPGPSFHPLSEPTPAPTATTSYPIGNLLDTASPLASAHPIAIEALPDGTVLILDRPDGGASLIERYDFGTQIGPPVSLAAIDELLPPGVTLDPTGHDLAFVPAAGTSDPLAGAVLVALASGFQTLAFSIASAGAGGATLLPLPEYYPMRQFGGRAIVTANGTPYYDFTNRFIPLVEQKRPRYATEGTLVTPVFDSGIPGCVWHRLLLDAAMPLGTTVQIATRAADDPATLAESPFLAEPPRLYQRPGSELPFAVLSVGLSSWELLFQQATGRYFQIQITMAGDGRHSPRVRALRAYYPRFSYMREYLPATYAANDTHGFLDRFLANAESALTPLEGEIAAAQVLFDPRAAPSDALDWLASWFGTSLDPAWDDLRRRLFIRHAMDLFQWRGTVRGIQMAIDLALSQHPCDAIFTRDDSLLPSGTRIIEQFATRLTPPALAGDPTSTAQVQNPSAGTWTPSQGGAALLALWQGAAPGASSSTPATSFPVSAPPDAATATAWTAFTQATLGFVPTSTTADQTRWTQFLFHRYSTISALNTAYGTAYPSFASILRPSALPADGPALSDWFQFEGLVMPIANDAHRFRVLIPIPPGASADLPTQQQRLDLVTRLIQLEQPAHTTFDVGFYWAMFRVGQVRLGYDTLLDQGSRVPELAPPFVLGHAHLLEGHLAPGFPQDATDRDVMGRSLVGPRSNASDA
jgi:phage tail-like protein